MRFIGRMSNGVLLQGRAVEVAGVRVVGGADPLAHSVDAVAPDKQIYEEGADRQAAALRAAIQREGQPDILLVHNPAVARRLAGMAPLAVSGHTHPQELEESGRGSVLLNPGTTGAAGLRGLSSAEGVPYSAIILYVRPGKGAAAQTSYSISPFPAV